MQKTSNWDKVEKKPTSLFGVEQCKKRNCKRATPEKVKICQTANQRLASKGIKERRRVAVEGYCERKPIGESC